jgi:hypothetical protein
MEEINIDQLINNKVNLIIVNKWDFLNYNWPVIHSKYKHRTIIKHINFIDIIKKKLVDKLGYIVVFPELLIALRF